MQYAIQLAAGPPTPRTLWLLSGFLLFVVLVGALIAMLVARRYLYGGSKSSDEIGSVKPTSDNPTAFVAASMQAVIKKLKEQEKELEALHRAERERAQHTERLSEAVTRNMPAGLLLLNSAGLVTSANPARNWKKLPPTSLPVVIALMPTRGMLRKRTPAMRPAPFDR